MRKKKPELEKVFEEIRPNVFAVRSFKVLDKIYEVNLNDNSCDCMAFLTGKTIPCKHILFVYREKINRKNNPVE